jgi:hypothetical protein
MSGPDLAAQEEVEEVEQKVAEAEHSRSAARRFFARFCTPVFLEAFALTFLAGACSILTAFSRAGHGSVARHHHKLEG